MNCIHCQSEAIVKNGTKTLKTGQVLQQYLCNTCGRRFNQRSGTPMARLRTPVTTVEMALNARHEGLGVRAAARVVGTSPSSITTWEERLSSHLPHWSLGKRTTPAMAMGFIQRPLKLPEILVSRGFQTLTL